MSYKKLVLTIIYLMCLWVPLRADFEDTGAGARAVGMGNSFVALADDPFCIYYNPAGLGFIRQSQVGTDYGKLWMGLTDNSNLNTSFISVVIPIFRTESGSLSLNKFKKETAVRKTKFKITKKEKDKAKEKLLLMLKTDDKAAKKDDSALSIFTSNTNFAATASSSTSAQPDDKAAAADDKLNKISHIGTFAVGWRNFTLTDFYQESAYYVGFGKSYKERLAYGINLKYLTEQYVIDDYLKQSPVFDYGNKSSVTNYSVDAGIIYNILPRLFFGCSASDINEPDLGLKQESKLPATYRLGLAWRQKGIKWAADSVNRQNKWYTSFGLEKWFMNALALRGGICSGGDNYLSSSFGFSVDLVSAEFDYAFQIPLYGIKDTSGSHRLSLVFRFGGRPKEELESGSLELNYSNLKDEVAGLKKNLSDTQFEKKKLEEVLIEESTLRIRERIKAAETEAKKTRVEERKKTVVQDENAQRTHIVRKGETLQTIAKEYYGDEKYWNNIYQANKDDIGRGGVLTPNQVLAIPPMSQVASPSALRVDQSPAQENVAIKRIDAPVQVIEVKPVGGAVQPEVQKPSKKESKKESKPAKKAEITGPKTHVVVSGENLQSIAQKYYNDSRRWKDIYKANKDKVIGGQVAPGQEIVIP
jgi:nucleoid-associated protein YgaU